MLFVPILFTTCAYLLTRSTIVAFIVAAVTLWVLYRPSSADEQREIRQSENQLAFRVLSVKLATYNGGVDDGTLDIHFLATADQPLNAPLRADLRDAAARDPEGWQAAAETLRRNFRRNPETLQERLESLIIQTNSTAGGMTPASQARLREIAGLWKVDARFFEEKLAHNGIAVIKPTAA